MILFTFLCQLVSIDSQQKIEKSIYLIEGENYKVNLDSIFNENKENTYSFQSSDKGFTLDTSSLKLKSDQGTYSIKPTRILRERQLINLEDYQGQGQFGILDQYESGHRICYNDDAEINLDQCIELDNTATSYDFVFISRNTVAVSMIRVADQQFSIRIYKDKQIISELYFVPSKTYAQVKQTIIEYSIFQSKKYLLFAVTEQDSNLKFLEIQDDFQIVNTNKVIDKSLLPEQQALQVYDIKGTLNKIYVVIQSSEQAKLVISFIFQTKWIQNDYFLSNDFRGLELGYSFINKHTTQTYLQCQQDSYSIISTQGDKIFQNFSQQIKPNAQVKYTLNYLIALQDNEIIVSTIQKVAQKTNIIERNLLKIDVEFQNDVLIIFTDIKIVTYYLKQATLSFQSNTITKSLDFVTIQAVAGEYQQIANIKFQVLSKQDYNLYNIKDINQDLYYNLQSTKFSIPLQGISGADIKVEGKVDDQIEIIPNYLSIYGIKSYEKQKQPVILEQFFFNKYDPFLFRQFDDFSYKLYDCKFYINSYYQCFNYEIFNTAQNQSVTLQYSQATQEKVQFALLNSDGLEISIFQGSGKKLIKTSQDNQFVDMKVGTDRLFVYRIDFQIVFYYFQSGEVISQLDLSQFGQPQGEFIRKLWVNQVKTNLMVISYGEDLIIGRFTTQFIFMQRITIKWVIDVQIITDNKFIVLSTDKTNKKLTQYILDEGTIKVYRELDTHAYIITGVTMLSDLVFEQIIIQAQNGQQKALLVFGNTELARDSLLKVIKLQEDQIAENVIYNENRSSLLIRATDPEKNSSIIDLNYNYQDFESKLTKTPNKFSQQLDLKYIYGSSFSQNKIEIMKKIYLEYQFQNITVKQSNISISYQNKNQLKIPIQQDTFYGQVKSLYFKPFNDHIELTTRFKNSKNLIRFDDFYECQQVVSFRRIICLGGVKITYHNIEGTTLSQIKLNYTIIQKIGYFKQMILRDDYQFALIRTEEKLILIHISQNEIQQSQTFYDWKIPLDITIFHKGWLIVYHNQLSYFKFQSQKNDSWYIEQQYEDQIQGIQAIQYDQITEQMFYSTGDSNLYYFRSSLEGDSINKQAQFSLNIPQLLKQFKIYQLDIRIQYIKIIKQYKKSYILISTSQGNICNITIQSPQQDFIINNMYILNGPSPKVYNIQLMDDYVIVQDFYYQFLYRNTPNQQLDRPNLALEGLFAQKIIGLFKNGSQIIHIYGYSRGMELDQSNIDEEVFLTIKNLSTNTNGFVALCATNDYQQEGQVNYQLVFQDKAQQLQDKLNILIMIIGVTIAIAIGLYYCYQNKRKAVKPLIISEKNVELI